MCMRPSDILDSAVVAQGGHVNWLHDKLHVHCMIIHHCPHTQLLQMLLSWFAEFSDQQKNMMLARLLVHA